MSTPIIAKVESAYGANLANAPGTWTWTDISTTTGTAWVRGDIGSVVVGRSDEAATSQPTQITFHIVDPSGNHVPRNPFGANYPNVRQNTPFRVTFATGVRAIVYADSYAVSWDESLKQPIVTVSASGSLRRLAQGKAQTKSVIRRRIESTGPVAYWPLEDGSSASVAASAVSDGIPMNVVPANTTAVVPKFSAVTGPAGSGQLPDFTSAASLAALIPASAGASTPWSFGFAVKVPTIPAGQVVEVMRLYSSVGSVWYWQVEVSDNAAAGVIVSGVYFTGSSFAINTNQGIDDGKWHWIKVDAIQSGLNINVNVYIDGSLAGGGVGWPATLSLKTLGAAASMLINQSQGNNLYPQVGHLALWNYVGVPDVTTAMNGYTGETATDRLTRLAAEAGVPITITGSSTTTMGAQAMGTAVDLMRACEAADGGILTDGGTNGGLTYLARSARSNLTAAFTLDNNLGQLAAPFTPIEDDQRRRNDWTVSRSGGSSARFTDSTGPQGTTAVGLYDDSTTLNVASDSQLLNQASWRVHLGTVEQMRYSPVVFNLRAHPELVTAWLAAGVGSRFTLKNLPSQHAPGDVDLVVEGWSEFCDGLQWLVSVNAGAYDPWRAFKIADAKLGGQQTAGSTLTANAATGATSLTVASSGARWIDSATYPSLFPLTVQISGIQVTVTAIAGTSSPQTFTVTGVTKALHSGDTVKLWQPGVLKL